MKKKKIIVDFLFISVYQVFQVLCGSSNKFPDQIVSNDGKLVTWTANWPTSSRVLFFGSKNLSIKFDCNKKHFNITDLFKAKICFKHQSPPLEECKRVNSVFSRSTLRFGPVKVDIEFNQKSGLTASMLEVPVDQELPLMYAECQLITFDNGYFTSNQIFLLDFRKNFPKSQPHVKKRLLRSQHQDQPQLNRNSESRVKCLQKGLGIDEKLKKSSELFRQPSVSVKFEWFLCSGDTVAACNKSKKSFRDVASFLDWPVQVLADGELYVPFVPADKESQLLNKRLVCYLNETVAFYSSPVKLVNSAKTGTELEMIRPRKERIILFNSSDYSITLPCLFKTSGPVSSIGWNYKKDGKTTPLSAGKTNDDLKVTVSAQSDSITLNGPFSEKTEGNYSCQVKQDNNPVEGNYHVKIKGMPRLDKSVPKAIDLPLCGFRSVPCRFQEQKRIIPDLAVMGDEVDFNSKETVNRSKADTNSKFNRKMNFTVNLIRQTRGKDLIYTEWKYPSSEEQRNDISPSHYITCIGYDPPFGQRERVELTKERTFKFTTSEEDNFKTCDVVLNGVNAKVSWEWFLLNDNTTCNADGINAQWKEKTYEVKNNQSRYLRCRVQLKSSSNVVFWEENYVFESGYTPPPPKDTNYVLIALVVAAAVVVVLVLAIPLIIWIKRRQMSNHRGKSPSDEGQVEGYPLTKTVV